MFQTSKRRVRVSLQLFAVALLLHVIAPTMATAGTTSLRAESLVRFLERDTVTENDALVTPAYLYLQFDSGTPGENDLTFHANGWGRADLSDTDYYKDQTSGELLYGYFQYQPAGKDFMARLGRQAIFAGVANESIDGIYLSSHLPGNMALSLYAGQPVALDSTNGRDGDSIYGGRLGLQFSGRHQIGASYKFIENDSIDAEEMAGIDLGLSFNKLFINGFSSYNLITEGFAEHSYEALFGAANARYRLFYQLFTFEDYFGNGANNANPFRILAQTSEELSSYGLEITHKVSDAIETGLKLARHDYDLEEASHYAGLLAAWHGNGLTSYGGEIGFSEGENGRNDMVLTRLYGYQELSENSLLKQVSIDALYAKYDQEIFGEDTSLFLSLSGSRNILGDDLTLKISADYESGPYFDSDIRGLVSLIYHYTKQ